MSGPNNRVAELLARFGGSARPVADLSCDGYDMAGALPTDVRDAVYG